MNLEFHDITLDEAPHYLEHWNMCAQRTSDYCFPIIWSLGPDYGTKIAYDGENDLYWLHQRKEGLNDLAPVGRWERDDWPQILRAHYGDEIEIDLVPEALAAIWTRELEGRAKVEVTDDRGTWEYLYDIRAEQINGGGSRQKSAQRVIDGIAASRRVPFERVVFALGIRFVGETSARLLARKFKSIDALANASLQELMDVDGVGEAIAKSVITYFHTPANVETVNRLRAYGLQMRLSDEQMQAQGTRLKGKSIVISGVFARHSRDEYKRIIEANGGKSAGSISGKTSFILAGDNMGPAKLQKAEKLGVPIIDEDTFLGMIE